MHEVSVDGRKHGVDHLLEGVVKVGLSLLSIGSYSGLNYIEQKIDFIDIWKFVTGVSLEFSEGEGMFAGVLHIDEWYLVGGLDGFEELVFAFGELSFIFFNFNLQLLYILL